MFWRQTKVFISYRRDDSAVHARDLHADLVEAFGRGHVFFDVREIGYGDRFADAIDRRLAGADVVVVVIGPRWATIAGADGAPRLLQPGDYVRREVAFALRSGKRVIPVRVAGAALPARAALPDDVAGLLDLSDLVLGDRQLGESADRLVDAIRGERATGVATGLERRKRRRLLAAAAAVSMFFAAWLALFDAVGLDTSTASATLWLADVAAPVAASDAVQIVAIDRRTEAALRKPFERNPAARRDHAALIRRLAQAGARSVAFDVFIVAPSPADDAVLLAAIAAAQAAHTAVVFGAEDIDDGVPVMLPALRDAVARPAMLCFGERLGYASTVPLASQKATRDAAAQADAVGLALAAADPGPTRVDAKARAVLVAGAGGVRAYPYSEEERVGPAQRCKPGPVGERVATALYRTAPLASLNHPDRRIAYEAVLAMDAAALRRRFEGRHVLVGLTMPEDDVHRTFQGLSTELRHGLELHADATGALLDGRIVQPLGAGTQFATMAAFALVGARLAGWGRPQGGARRLAALAGVVLAGLAGAVALCAGAGRLLNPTYPIGALAIGYALAARALRAG